MQVITDRGPGKVIDQETSRGQTRFLVAGRGFQIWVDQQKVHVITASDAYPDDDTGGDSWDHPNKDNSTTLPWNGEPQHPAYSFPPESTIQPGEYPIDADERTHPSDSLTFEDRAEPRGPQPSPDLFAKGAARHPGHPDSWPFKPNAADYDEWDRREESHGRSTDSPTHPDRHAARYANPALLALAPELLGGAEAAGAAGGTAGALGEAGGLLRTVAPALGMGHGGDDDSDEEEGGDESPGLPQDERLKEKGIDESPLGAILDPLRALTGYIAPAGPKFASLAPVMGSHLTDPVQRFRDDPVREIQRQGHLMAGQVTPALEEYGHLIEADKHIRIAAWVDVRDKAKRLRAAGRVHIHDVGEDRIYASVKGDHGMYDVMIKKGHDYAPSYGGSGSQSISNWSCTCPWGSWAFKRTATFIGRLCSHGLASYWELQSQHTKGQKPRRRTASAVSDFTSWAEEVGAGTDADAVTSYIVLHPELSSADVGKLYTHVTSDPDRKDIRDFEEPIDQDDWASELFSGGGRSTPNLIFPADDDSGDRSKFVDPTSDDRETTGPDQIVHFSRREARGVKDLFHEPKDDEVYKALPAELWHEQNFPGEEFPHGGGQMALMPMSELALHEARQIQSYYDMNGLPYPAELRTALRRTSNPFDSGPMYDLMGVDRPAAPKLDANPFEGGGFDPTKLPGVSGGPNTDPVADPTGGMLTPPGSSSPSASSGGLGGSAADGLSSGGGSSSDGMFGPGGSTGTSGGAAGGWGGGDSSGTDSSSGGSSSGGWAGGGSSSGGSGWTANDISPNSIGTGDYTIKPGDTLSEIAQGAGYGDNYQALADQNNLSDPDMIQAGGTLKIPGLDSASEAPGAATDTSGSTEHGTSGGGDGVLGPVDPVSTADTTIPTTDMPTATEPPPGPAPAPIAPGDIGATVAPPAPVNTDPRLSRRFFFAEDFEDDDKDGTGALATDSAEPGVAGNGGIVDSAAPAQTAEQSSTAADAARPMDLHSDPAEPGVAGNSAFGGGGGGFDPSMLMGLVEPIVQGVSNFAQPIAQGIGQGIGNLFTARIAASSDEALLDELRDLTDEKPSDNYGHMDDHNDEVAYVIEELRNRGYDVSQMVAAVQRRAETAPFAGSGPAPKDYWTTSAQYVEENERPHMVDLTDLDGPITKYSDGDKPRQKASARDADFDMFEPRLGAASDDNSDIVRQFHASGGAIDASSGSGGGGGITDDMIATRAAGMARTAGRIFTLAEQRDLEDEVHPLGARNKPTREDLKNTHYVSN